MPIRLGESTFLRLTTAAALLTALAYVIAAVTVARQGNASRATGWTATAGDSGWVVATVDERGPAAMLLRPGDRLVAIDGDTAVGRIGPAWILRDAPHRSSYVVQVVRDGQAVEVQTPWPVRQEPGLAFWRWMYLAIGLVYLTTGLMIAYAKPESDVARRAVVSAVLAAAFFLGASLHSSAGMLSGVPLVLASVAYAVRPLHLIAGYRFNAAFPIGAPSAGGWRLFERTLYVVAVLVWIPAVAVGALRLLGPDRAAQLVARYAPLLQDTTINALGVLIAGVVSVANVLVVWRNYRHVDEPDLKRRVRWVSLGVAAGMLPILVVVPLLILRLASGEQLVSIVRVVNTITVVMPLCIAYAIIKHRVLGVQVVLRTGLRYMLTKNVLRVALAGPAALIVWSLATNPGASLFELGTGSGRWRLILIALAAIGLRYRGPLLHAIDRRFFREAYRQDQIFATLAEAIGRAADVREISRLLSSQLQDALHPRRIFAVAREGGSRDAFSLLYSSSGEGHARGFGDFDIAPHAFEDIQETIHVDAARTLGAREREALSALDIQLLAPIRGPNEGLVGLLLLGAKRSEEPYTANDRRMLDTITSQTGVVWENVRLRERLNREQAVRREMLARADGGARDVVLECPACGACYDASASTCASDGRELTMSAPVPKTLDGKYDLRRLIGRGGMGAVYEAMDLRLERTVAVKVATGSVFGDSVALQRFGREARASAKLDHPNAVRALDYGEVPHGAYLVLEYLHGENLRALIRRHGRLGPRETARILEGVFAGVAAAHERGIVHRDLKPENIFLVQGATASGGGSRRCRRSSTSASPRCATSGLPTPAS
ncbi:MAG: protein kinase [Gemmatimonadaceae bacterium]